MTAVVLDKWLERRLIARRRRLGIDHFDEVWDGVYVMAPAADIEHFSVSFDLAIVLNIIVKAGELGEVFTGVNISDRKEGWRKNFRVPDISVFLNDNLAEDCGTHWSGGPDLAVEIVSPKDRSRKKIPFYEKIGTRELLIVDRKPWRLTLYRLIDGELREVGKSTLNESRVLASQVVPLSFQLTQAADKPAILLTHLQDGRQWTVEPRKHSN
jgi:Uma2 family endonuclease